MCKVVLVPKDAVEYSGKLAHSTYGIIEILEDGCI
jgi:hypothetical protein